MPNWCDNTVTIKSNDQEKLVKLHEAMLKHSFLEFVIPVPEELKNPQTSSYGGDDKDEKDALRQRMFEKYGHESWYDFCTSRWGTKWDVEIFSPILEDGQLRASFSSAWSPPIGIYQELTEQGFDVDAMFYEPAMDFAGTYTSDEGELVYSCEDMPLELDDHFGHTRWQEEMEEDEA
jgi:hypothetical protein